ncbi:MAG: NAD(+)/NADH kinase [Bacteroidales bacterium]
MKIAIFARDIYQEWVERLLSILNLLYEREADLLFYTNLHQKLSLYRGKELPAAALFSSGSDLPQGVDLFLAFGGDGTFLESLTIIGDRKIAVAGVNFGRLGFLAGLGNEPDHLWVDKLLAGQFNIERRGLLSLSFDSLPPSFFSYALNEISIHRSDPYMISLFVKIDGRELPPYRSDGLVLSTPTGSTAYSLSIGGPIVAPGVKALILSPISPHNLNMRPLVISDSSEVEIFVESRVNKAVLSVDNRSLLISDNQLLKIKKAPFELNYLSLTKEGFIGALREKLMWGEDRRNH